MDEDGVKQLRALLNKYRTAFEKEAKLYSHADFDDLHVEMYNKLEQICSALTKNEKRLCVLFMSHPQIYICELLGKSHNTICVALCRIREKLHIKGPKELKAFLINVKSLTPGPDARATTEI